MGTSVTPAAARGVWPLQFLNFFMADAHTGIRPFLGVFPLTHGWASGAIGTVMTMAVWPVGAPRCSMPFGFIRLRDKRTFAACANAIGPRPERTITPPDLTGNAAMPNPHDGRLL